MKTWQVWIEGYSATGDHATASLLGLYEAETFKEAVKKHYQAHPIKDPAMYWNEERLTYWGCNHYDNEKDARKHFG